MFKVILVLKKKPELTRAQFMDYYDNQHLPSMHAILPTGASIHRRNYVVSDGSDENETATFDVMTELFYKSQEDANLAMQALSNPQIRKIVEADEDKFILRGSLRKYVVEVHETIFQHLPEHSL